MTSLSHITHRLTLSLFLILSISYSHPEPIHSADTGLAINPAVVKITIKPGTTITQVINIQNQSLSDKELIARIQPFSDSRDGHPILKLTSVPIPTFFQLANTHIDLDKPFPLKSGEKTQLILNISTPSDSATADHYFNLIVSEYTRDSSGQTMTNLYGSIVTNILMTVSPILHPATSLSTAHINLKSSLIIKLGDIYLADNLDPISAHISITNVGRHITETSGYVSVTDWRDQNQKNIGLLPLYLPSQQTRSLQDTDGQVPTFEPHLFHLGPHTLSLKINSDNTQHQDQVTIIFLPIKALLALIIMYIITKSLLTISTKDRQNT
jgi:hypothetical protein